MMKKVLLSAVLALTAWVAVCGQEFESQVITDKPACSFSFAVFADPHISIENEKSAADLRSVVNDVNNNPGIAFVVVVGDVSDKGDYESLMHAKNILNGLNCRYYVIPGNHDMRWSMTGGEDFRRVFGDDKFRLQFNGYLFLGINTAASLWRNDGHVAVQDIEWMRRQLKNIGRKSPVYIFAHHPLKTGDVDNWFDLTDVVRRHNVQAFIGGHYHRNMIGNYDGITGVINRSVQRDEEGKTAYTMYEICGDSLYVSDKRVGYVPQYWSILKIEDKLYVEGDEKLFPRPDYSCNAAYKGVKERWKRNVGYAIYGSPATDGTNVYFGDDKGVLHAYSLEKGKEMWSVKTGGRICGGVTEKEGRILFGSGDGNVYCVDNKGEVLWRANAGGPVMSRPAVKGDTVFAGGGEGRLMALSLKDGAVLWSYDEAEGVVVGAGYTDEGNALFYIKNEKGELVYYLLDGNDGSFVERLDEEKKEEIYANAKSYTVRNEEGKTVSYDDVDWSPWISVETKARLRRGLPVVSGTDDGGVMCIGMDGVKWMYKICNTEVNNPVQVSETDYIVTDADGNVRRLSVKM